MKGLLGIAIAVAMGGTALAADLPVKAAAVPWLTQTACTPTSCSGFYGGVTVGGVGTSLDIIGSGVNGSVFGGGGVFLANAGYQYAVNNIFIAAEAAVGGQVSTNANVLGVTGNQNGFMAYEIVKFGGNLSTILGTTSPPISVPSGLTQYLINPYVLVGAVERSFATGWATGAGATFDISPRLFLDLKYMYINYGASSNGAANFNSENLILAGINYKIN